MTILGKDMWSFPMKCKKCGEDYIGHPRSKYCKNCRKSVLARQQNKYAKKSQAKYDKSIRDRVLSEIEEKIYKMRVYHHKIKDDWIFCIDKKALLKSLGAKT